MYAFKIGHPVHWLTQKLWPSWESANSDKFFLPSGTPFYTFRWNSSICHRWHNSAIGDSRQQGQLSLLVAKSVPVGDKIITNQIIVTNSLTSAIMAGYRLIDTADSYENHQQIAAALGVILPSQGLSRSDLFILKAAQVIDENCCFENCQ